MTIPKKLPDKSAAEYGHFIRKKRQELAAKLDAALSVSKRRKVVRRQVIERRHPLKVFDHNLGTACDALLKSVKSKKNVDVEKRCEQVLEILYSAASPLTALNASSDAEEVDRLYSRPAISRALQHCMKHGTIAQRLLIRKEVMKSLSKLAQLSAGHHLCVKIYRYSSTKQEKEELVARLVEDPKSYFTKYGSRTWDYVLRSSGYRASVRNKMLMKLFLERISSMEVSDPSSKSFEEVIEVLTDKTVELLKVHLLECIDRIVKKELLEGELAQIFLSRILMSGRLADETFIKSVSEAVFDGAAALLASKDGVTALCRICGFWSAKERKTFLTTMKSQIQINQTSWCDYLCNEADSIFVTRLLETIDDTRLSGESILCSAMGGVKFQIDGTLKFADRERLVRLLMNPKATSSIVRLAFTDQSKRFFTQHELQLLELPSPTSKKDNDQRRNELVTRYILPILKQFQPLTEPVLQTIQDPKHQNMLNLINNQQNDD